MKRSISIILFFSVLAIAVWTIPARDGEATSIECFTPHSYRLILKNVTHNGTPVETEVYSDFILTLYTGPPSFFSITVNHAVYDGQLIAAYRTRELGGGQ